jgi:hypothetical protein
MSIRAFPLSATLLDRAPRKQGDDRLIRLVAGITAAPGRALLQIAAQLEACTSVCRVAGTRWQPFRHLLTSTMPSDTSRRTVRRAAGDAQFVELRIGCPVPRWRLAHSQSNGLAGRLAAVLSA